MIDFRLDGVLDEFLAQLSGNERRIKAQEVNISEENQDVALPIDRP